VRTSIDVPGLDHVNPVPSASRVGRFFMTSGISGRDPATGTFPATIEEQCARMFASLRTMLELARAAPDDVVKITVWLKEGSAPPCLNGEWMAMFPDPHSRPARSTLANPLLDAPMLMQCDCLAVMSTADGR
jgi:2-iminobutanoate/2-iminopropanoate deaminase